MLCVDRQTGYKSKSGLCVCVCGGWGWEDRGEGGVESNPGAVRVCVEEPGGGGCGEG